MGAERQCRNPMEAALQHPLRSLRCSRYVLAASLRHGRLSRKLQRRHCRAWGVWVRLNRNSCAKFIEKLSLAQMEPQLLPHTPTLGRGRRIYCIYPYTEHKHISPLLISKVRSPHISVQSLVGPPLWAPDELPLVVSELLKLHDEGRILAATRKCCKQHGAGGLA